MSVCVAGPEHPDPQEPELRLPDAPLLRHIRPGMSPTNQCYESGFSRFIWAEPEPLHVKWILIQEGSKKSWVVLRKINQNFNNLKFFYKNFLFFIFINNTN